MAVEREKKIFQLITRVHWITLVLVFIYLQLPHKGRPQHLPIYLLLAAALIYTLIYPKLPEKVYCHPKFYLYTGLIYQSFVSSLVYLTGDMESDLHWLFLLPILFMASYYGTALGFLSATISTAFLTGIYLLDPQIADLIAFAHIWFRRVFVFYMVAFFVGLFANEEISERTELETSRDLCQHYMRNPEIKDIVSSFCQKISTVLNAGICLLMFYDPEKDALVAQEPAVGLTKNKIDALVIPMKAGGSLVSVFQEDKPFISNSVLKDPSTKKFFHGYDIKNLVIMPLKGRAKMMGVMCVANKKGGFTQRDLELLTTSARQTAIYAERTQFYEATKRNAKQSMLLHRLSKDLSSTLDLKVLQKLIVENVVHLLDAHKCSLMLVDEESGQLTVCATHGLDDEITRNTYTEAQERVARWVAETGRTLLLANSNDPRFQDVKYKGGVCSVLSVPLKVKDKVIGVLNAGSLCPHQFTKEDLRILSTLASEVAIAIHNAQLFAEIEELYLDTMKAMVRAIEAKDPYTRGHSERVTDYALAIAEELDLSEKEKELLYTAGLLHDIGKIGIGEEILLKPGKLTKEEYDVVKRHPLIGTQILGTIKALREAIPLILHHHEHYDGSGYVSGLKGEDIPLSSRILAVADAFEAMTSHRPYRKALGFQEAIEELKKNAGTQFDPIIVEAFMRVVGVSDISRD